MRLSRFFRAYWGWQISNVLPFPSVTIDRLRFGDNKTYGHPQQAQSTTAFTVLTHEGPGGRITHHDCCFKIIENMIFQKAPKSL